MSGIDLNRAGTPLLEIVTEPDMRSAEEAVAYAKALHKLIVDEIGICDGNMQEGSFRCDANVSVRPAGSNELGTRCEIKNLNSFRFMEQAIKFEVRRQIELIEDGGRVVQETRLYDPDRDETRSMRSKEDAMDYRYFPDPDLPPLEISEQWIDAIKTTIQEPLEVIRERFVSLGVSTYKAGLLTGNRAIANYSGPLITKTATPEIAANVIIGPLSAKLNEENLTIDQSKISADLLDGLVRRISDNTISASAGAAVIINSMWRGEGDADSIIAAKGLKQISDSGEIEKIVDEVLAANAQQVVDYKSGKDKAFNSLVGQVMKASKGKANPAQVNALLKQKLARD